MSDDMLDRLREHGLEKLDVFVRDRHVATLAKEGRRYVLTYLPTAARDDFVSLSMPVRMESWVSEGRLHPFFEMNLPEGTRRDAIAETFGKAMISEEMSLLAITGNDSVGRVTVVPSGFPLDWKARFNVNVDEVADLPDTDAFFVRALHEHAAQGVSGVQPKVLVTDQRVTLLAENWIIKHDGADTAWLSVNEYLSMQAANACGIDVPECRLSRDGKSLFVKRFDREGRGFEDMCAIMGLTPIEKYSGTMERLVKVASLIVSDRQAMKESVLRAIVFNMCIGNSDAHLKNFGVVYDGTDCRMSPFFDLVSVRAFPAFKNDIPSLSINGKKEWVIGKAFHDFARNIGVPSKRVEEIISEVEVGVKQVLPSIASMAVDRPEFREHAKAMIASWATGLKRIRGEKLAQDSYDALTEFGFSRPKPAEKEKKPSRRGHML